jgi:3-hydroxyisobutyrate dehydrogenase-like beta-hydroxyacid dehydrogenase
MKVAFCGLGIMGGPMAANLAKAGHEVRSWNRTPKDIVGTKRAANPAEAAKDADVLWLCVSDTAAVEQVLLGANGAAQSLRAGMVVADSSTISPKATEQFAARVREKGADYVDAPITGSKIGAENGQLIFMVGGEESTLAKLDPLFKAMGKEVRRMGGVTKGQSAKLAMNLQIALTFEGFVEGITLARKLGVKPEDLVGLIGVTMVRSGVVDYKAPFVLKHDYTPNFPLRLMYKDIKLMLEAGREAGVELPGLETVAQIYEQASKEGKADLDYAATLDIIERMAGIAGGTQQPAAKTA